MQLHTTVCVIKNFKSESSHSDWQSVGYNQECAQSSLVYEAVGSVEVRTPTTANHVSRIVLPEYGAIVIHDENPIVLQENPDPKKCPSGWQNYLKQRSQTSKSWYSPDMWSTENQPSNAATPHVDRIPCECDIASIFTNRSLSIRMNELDDVVNYWVTINGQNGSLRQLLGTELGTMMMGQLGAVSEAVDPQCSSKSSFCGCHSPVRFQRVYEAVCANVQCSVAHCESPVRPLGHCCSICGAVLQTELTANECKDNPPALWDHQLQGALREKAELHLLSQVEVYENFYPNYDSGPINRFILQLVLVDRGDLYEERSSQLAVIIADKFRKNTSFMLV